MAKLILVVEDEVKMITQIRALESQNMLHQQIKIFHRMLKQYNEKGVVFSVDGRKLITAALPSADSISQLFEVERKWLNDKNNIIVNINQFNDNKFLNVNQFAQEYLGKLSSMEPDQIESEISNLKQLRLLIDDGYQNDLQEELKEQKIIDITPEKEPAS